MWDSIFPYVAALLPTVAVATLFYYLVKNILEGDRRERLAQSKWDADHNGEESTSVSPDKSGGDSLS
ncbi:MAG: lysyl-tRNA synthetase [Lapillicoccus sp.]